MESWFLRHPEKKVQAGGRRVLRFGGSLKFRVAGEFRLQCQRAEALGVQGLLGFGVL